MFLVNKLFLSSFTRQLVYFIYLSKYIITKIYNHLIHCPYLAQKGIIHLFPPSP